MQHGGTVVMNFGIKAVTHLVCTSLSGTKTQYFLQTKPTNMKCVRPEWLFESIANGRVMPERSYPVVHSEKQTKITFETAGPFSGSATSDAKNS
ncbi:hypothetical protein HKX48_000025 [Thoreauomyces humboldtii]|nr:hypothetical protein HKX48_000025 [Thoreauomyces humboldtii]